MATSYPGVYRAKAQRLDGSNLTANIPQVFGTQDVLVTSFVGSPPTSQVMGWVAFHGGRPEFPVWLGGGTGGGGTVTDSVWVGPDPPTDPSVEMWWDTDETAQAPSWVTLPLTTNWSNFAGWQAAQYRKVDDIVYLRGLVACSNVTTPTIANLPAEYRPNFNAMFVCWLAGNATSIRAAVRVEIGTNGDLLWQLPTTTGMPSGTSNAAITSVTHLSLDNCIWSTS